MTACLHDFGRFARAQCETGDIDPSYPVLSAVYRLDGVSPEDALWRTLLYVTWYDLGVAAEAWERWPTARSLAPSDFARPPPTGTERRGFRGQRGLYLALRQIDAVLRLAAPFGGLRAWVADAASVEGLTGWNRVKAFAGWNRVGSAFAGAPGNGAWAGWKWADLMAHVHGFAIEPNGIALGTSGIPQGPVRGLRALYPSLAWSASPEVAATLRLLVETSGVETMDRLETALCDFGSLVAGRYYVGHDIDLQQEHLHARGAPNVLWTARVISFDPGFRGEASGWDGVRRELKPLYRDEGRLYLPWAA